MPTDLPDWRKHAACLGQPVDRFFPEDPNCYKTAVRLCRGCQVRRECLEEALLVPGPSDRFGVFGGMSPPARRRLRQQRERAALDRPVALRHEPVPIEWNPDTKKYEVAK